MQSVGRVVQGWALQALVGGLRVLGPVGASKLGGAVARAMGPFLPASRVANANLVRALPELDGAARRRVVRDVWDNVGRIVGELPHLASLRRTAAGPGWEIEGAEHVAAAVASGRAVLFYSGHLANWEMLLPAAGQLGMVVSGIYRAPSDPAVDALTLGLRAAALPPGAALFAKGAKGARQVLRHVAAGGHLGVLVDQKMNDGIAVPFFGRPAMTAPALAQLGLRFGCALLPARVERLGPARFRMVVEPHWFAAETGDRVADTLRAMERVNADLERWVRARPGEWLWLHRRWPKEVGG